jgi:hypothetical protein
MMALRAACAYGIAYQRATEEMKQGPLAKGRGAAILQEELAEIFTDGQSAMLAQRRALFSDIAIAKLCDADWRKLATLRLPRDISEFLLFNDGQNVDCDLMGNLTAGPA